MNSNILAVFLALAPCAVPAASFSGLDQFGGVAKNPVRWGPDLASNVGQFVQTNDRLHFITVGTVTDDDFMAWPWQVGNAPWDRDWSVQLDVQVPFLPLAPGSTAVGVGLVVFNSANSDDTLTMHLEQVRSGGPQMRNFFSNLHLQGAGTETSVPAPFESGSVQLRWNATNQTLSASWDGTGGADGYAWTLLNSFSPALPATWSMGPTNSFIVGVVGYAEETAVSLTNQVTMDNFFLQDETRTPLRLDQSETNVVLSWPGEAVSFQLQNSLTVTGAWANVGQTASVVNERRQVILPASGNQFFRLKRD